MYGAGAKDEDCIEQDFSYNRIQVLFPNSERVSESSWQLKTGIFPGENHTRSFNSRINFWIKAVGMIRNLCRSCSTTLFVLIPGSIWNGWPPKIVAQRLEAKVNIRLPKYLDEKNQELLQPAASFTPLLYLTNYEIE